MNRKETAILAGVLMSALITGSAYADHHDKPAEGGDAKADKHGCKGHAKKKKGGKGKEGCGKEGCGGEHKEEKKD